MVALLFPGQGSQFVGMGRDLAERFPLARALFEEADDALGVSLSRLMWEGPEEELTATHNAQPAILLHSVAVHRLVQERLGEVAFSAGHSLGEFSAYVAAGALGFADALRAVRRRGELMYRSGTTRPGAMAAIIGLEDAALASVCDAASTDSEVCVPANFNSPAQTVISGDTAAVDRALAGAKAAGAKRAVRLNVSGAFHSPLMQDARAGLAGVLDGIAFETPRFPVVSNVTAQPVADPEDARRLLVEQLTSAVRWSDSVRTMAESGVDRFLELGPGSVLSGLMKRIQRDASAQSIGTAEEVEAFAGA